MSTDHVPLCIIAQPTSQRFREETNGCQNRRKRNEDDGHRLSGRCDGRSIEAEDITIVHDTLQTYERATVVKINIQKSKVIALDSWNTSLKVMELPYYTERCLVFIYRIPNMSQRKKLECGDNTDSHASSRIVTTAIGLGLKNTIFIGIPFG